MNLEELLAPARTLGEILFKADDRDGPSKLRQSCLGVTDMDRGDEDGADDGDESEEPDTVHIAPTPKNTDAFHKWTSGFVPGAFAPAGQNGPARAPIDTSDHVKHGKADWSTQPAWKGAGGATPDQQNAALPPEQQNAKDLSTPDDVATRAAESAEKVRAANNLPHVASKVKPPAPPADPNAPPQPADPAAPAGQGAPPAAPGADSAQPPGGAPPSPAKPPPGPAEATALASDAVDPPQPQQPTNGALVPPPGTPLPDPAAVAQAALMTWPEVNATPVGSTGGSVLGGNGYYSVNGIRGFVKFYANPEQGQSEKLANDLYRAVGINAPQSTLVSIGGRKAVFNELVGAVPMKPGAAQGHPQMHGGFAMDAILANHDVGGQGNANVMQDLGGQAHRTSNGGALRFRAGGTLKAGLEHNKVFELGSMRNPQYDIGKTFAGLSNEEVGHQIAAIVGTLTPDVVAQLVAQAGFRDELAMQYNKLINGRIAAAAQWAAANESDGGFAP